MSIADSQVRTVGSGREGGNAAKGEPRGSQKRAEGEPEESRRGARRELKGSQKGAEKELEEGRRGAEREPKREAIESRKEPMGSQGIRRRDDLTERGAEGVKGAEEGPKGLSKISDFGWEMF